MNAIELCLAWDRDAGAAAIGHALGADQVAVWLRDVAERFERVAQPTARLA